MDEYRFTPVRGVLIAVKRSELHTGRACPLRMRRDNLIFTATIDAHEIPADITTMTMQLSEASLQFQAFT
jgi:hypothetical protein